jgi:hypothetical protein
MKFINRIRGIFRPPSDDSETSRTDQDGSGYPKLIIPEDICEHTIRGLRSHSPGTEDHEGVVYWAGHTLNAVNAQIVTTCLVPDAETSPGSFHIPPAADAKVVHQIHENSISGIGLVHSHPSAWTSHSPGDDQGAGLVFDGFYSVIVPSYGADGMLPIERCGIHRYENNQFHELDDSSISEQFEIVQSPPQFIDTRNL